MSTQDAGSNFRAGVFLLVGVGDTPTPRFPGSRAYEILGVGNLPDRAAIRDPYPSQFFCDCRSAVLGESVPISWLVKVPDIRIPHGAMLLPGMRGERSRLSPTVLSYCGLRGLLLLWLLRGARAGWLFSQYCSNFAYT